MDIHKIKLLLNTVKYLQPTQVYYRLYYLFRNRIFSREARKKQLPEINSIKWESKINFSTSYLPKTKTFTFLNISHDFSDHIDWNYKGYGKLWTYNLNYFDFLNQKEMSKEIGKYLIDNFIENEKVLKDGKEPYPISLRGINWVKFLSKNNVKDFRIDKILYQNYYTLLKNLEYHLLGNHLLENAFSLLFGAYYFQDENLYNKSKYLLISELNEQVLKDGAHFELSPMYHQIILSRLLDSIHLIKLNNNGKKMIFYCLIAKASLMVSWLRNVTYTNGEIPMVNDATLTLHHNQMNSFLMQRIRNYSSANTLYQIQVIEKLKLRTMSYLLMLVMWVPDYQPGHAHSDTFNFELIKGGNPIFVDRGISTYEKSSDRRKRNKLT